MNRRTFCAGRGKHRRCKPPPRPAVSSYLIFLDAKYPIPRVNRKSRYAAENHENSEAVNAATLLDIGDCAEQIACAILNFITYDYIRECFHCGSPDWFRWVNYTRPFGPAFSNSCLFHCFLRCLVRFFEGRNILDRNPEAGAIPIIVARALVAVVAPCFLFATDREASGHFA
ncbi:hypothetical protein KPP2020_065 [Klebsiella phage KPP2020]|uniref:Uncharacterized protein n=1 Tax=Klebsiella phage KPP2020 TaxID=3017288 RepID=A0AAE9YJB5_9CAUD|nr:hypothetical protein KPP2020_065 [Klebsiella phage KPP2020]